MIDHSYPPTARPNIGWSGRMPFRNHITGSRNTWGSLWKAGWKIWGPEVVGIFSRLFPCISIGLSWGDISFLTPGAPLVLRLAGVPRQFWVDWRPLGGPKELRGVWQGIT